MFSELIDEATKKAGSLQALADALSWAHSSILRSRRENVVSPYRAAQLFEFVGEPPMLGVMMALECASKTPAEKDFWKSKFRHEMQTFELLRLSRIERHARVKAAQAGEDGAKYRAAAEAARTAIDEAVKDGAELPPSMK